MAKDRRSRDQKRKAKQERKVRRGPDQDEVLAYHGGKYRKDPKLHPVFEAAEQGIHEADVALNYSLSDSVVVNAMQTLIQGLRKGTLPELVDPDAIENPERDPEGFVIACVRASWETRLKTNRPSRDAQVGVLRTMLGGIECRPEDASIGWPILGGSTRGYLGHLRLARSKSRDLTRRLLGTNLAPAPCASPSTSTDSEPEDLEDLEDLDKLPDPIPGLIGRGLLSRVTLPSHRPSLVPANPMIEAANPLLGLLRGLAAHQARHQSSANNALEHPGEPLKTIEPEDSAASSTASTAPTTQLEST
ncbi:hypothetical protein Isop_0355 [Isosphaera pallida ATCC 43644]|jgi:hypothetical protein|uniref:Uncharacterized protein n=1 Tax=Isosphaera pallida (strain ATCC 43644 / DSM 9630 / IS1B) TaxID=575540 RepID=E8QXX1_ISOPI|nr:hypothetical protein [Isosphaera pallida]ADV60950.1 hypothetical protein Isop_0355 [Isosphaera pallida ATCC 43644]